MNPTSRSDSRWERNEDLRRTGMDPEVRERCPYCGMPEGGLLCDDDHCREPGGPFEEARRDVEVRG